MAGKLNNNYVLYGGEGCVWCIFHGNFFPLVFCDVTFCKLSAKTVFFTCRQRLLRQSELIWSTASKQFYFTERSLCW